MKIINIYTYVFILLFLCSCGTISPNSIGDIAENSPKLIIHFNTSGIYLKGDVDVSVYGLSKSFTIPVDSYNNVVLPPFRAGKYDRVKIEVSQKNNKTITFDLPFHNLQRKHTYMINIDYNNGRFSMKESKVINSSRVAYLSNVVVDRTSPYKVDSVVPDKLGDMSLVWNDEFDTHNKQSFDTNKWQSENGFVRNKELQWYKADNANTDGKGNMVLEARREIVNNPNYNTPVQNEGNKWKVERKMAEYSSASINTKDKFWFTYGTLLVRAKIPTDVGCWPAIWTLGDKPNVGSWPACGEIDVMEFYRKNDIPGVLANTAFASNRAAYGIWDSSFTPLSKFTSLDKDWASKYHIWRLDWNKDFIRIYLDGVLLNETNLSNTINGNNGGKGGEGINPFHHRQYILLNLAIGQNGGDPTNTKFPQAYYIDYVRVYQHK